MQAKEFLGNTDIEFQSFNIGDQGEGARIHKKLGNPTTPSLVVNGKVHPIGHVSQIASILGLPSPHQGFNSTRLGWDIVSILDNWLVLLGGMDFELMLTPTKSRGRSIRLLTVNTFHPIALLPIAWHDGSFEWHTKESDERRESVLTDERKVREYARECLVSFQSFLMSNEEELGRQDPIIHTATRGDLAFSVLIHSQRSHAAIHHRQLVDFLRSFEMPVENAFDVEGIADLALPRELY